MPSPPYEAGNGFGEVVTSSGVEDYHYMGVFKNRGVSPKMDGL